MKLNKDKLKDALLEIIKSIGKEINGYIVFGLNKLLKEWERDQKGRFSQHGHGKMLEFLRRELQVEDCDGGYRINISSDETSNLAAAAITDDTESNSASFEAKNDFLTSPPSESAWPKRKSEEQQEVSQQKVRLEEVKRKVLTVIRNFLVNNDGRTFLTLNELSTEWQHKHPNEKFRDYGFGGFTSFLVNKCNMQSKKRRKSESFNINLRDVETRLKNMHLGGEDTVENIEDIFTTSSSRKEGQYGQSVRKRPGYDGMGNTKETGMISSGLPSKGTGHAEEAGLDNTSQGTSTDIQLPVKGFSDTERNFIQLVTVLYKCGLEALRGLFLQIHPDWTNQPSDLVTFQTGQLKLDSHEKMKFNSGDINEWDITLTCKVLLLSKKSKRQLNKKKQLNGFEDAIKTIRNIKNKLLSHNKSNEVSDIEYEKSIKDLQRSVVKLGFDAGDFEAALQGADLTKSNLYYQMFLEELNRREQEQRNRHGELVKNQKEIKEELCKVHEVLEKVEKKMIPQSEISKQLKSQPGHNEWRKIKQKLRNFDVDNNQYILVVDRFEKIDEEYVKVLATVPWKLVIDLDPESDINGFLTHFNPGETKGGIITTFTPSKLRNVNVDSLIDTRRMQWFFANGRSFENSSDEDENEDRNKETFREWKKSFRAPVQELIRACCQKLDHMKPMFCIILGIRSGVSIQIAQEIVEEIDCKFELRKFSRNYISFATELDLEDFPNATFTNLSINLFLLGLTSLLGIPEEKYKLPSGQKELEIHLKPRQFNFLAEYLELLYIGCQEIPEELTDEEKETFKIEHLKKFLSGNAISFPSLYFRQDATRHVTSEVCSHISEMLQKIQKPQIVQITHAPGSGGTTIARRALWDLHKKHPCAIVKLEHAPENFSPDSDGEKYINSLCERIFTLEEICEKPPVILIDGNSRQVRVLSDCIVRKLDGKAVILRCANYEKPTETSGNDDLQPNEADKDYFKDENEYVSMDRNDSYFTADDDFKVNPRLKDDEDDFSEFKVKFDTYCKLFPRDKTQGPRQNHPRERVFHFPMMAMLGEFEMLEGIVNESLDILKNDQAVEYEIAILVAFLQLYSNFATPACLVSKYFKKNSKTYREVTGHFSEILINLMVPESPPSKEKFIGASDDFDIDDEDDDDDWNSEDTDRGSSSSNTSHVIQSYTFQHHEVAKLVLKHSGRGIDQITQDFLQNKILVNYRKDDETKPLIDNLFLYNKESTEAHFSMLVVELAKEANGGRIFEEAAKQTKDVTFYSHVARFFSYKSDFKKARKLIKEGFEAEANAPIEKRRGVLNTEGHIVLMEMKFDKGKNISDLESLKKCAKEALDLFTKARDNPPRTYPNPLIGEVTVWQFCFEWIIRKKKGDAEEAIKFILKDKFFTGAIGECIFLLDEVDRIVETVPTLNDPGYTKRLANERRRVLVQTIGRARSKTKRKGWQKINIDRLCDEIFLRYQKTAPEKEIIRLRIIWMLNEVDKKVHLLDRADREMLFWWLKRLVNDYQMFMHTHDLMDAAAEQIKPPFDIDEALKIVNRWQEYLPNDPFSYFYQYVLCFLKVANGLVFDYRPTYESAIEACKKKTQGNPRKHLQQYFIGKEGESGSICTLLTRSKLETRYGGWKKHAIEERREDILDQTFWDKHSRDYLLECRGRIECKQTSFKGKKQPFIYMEPGNVRVSVPKNAIGTANLDYQPDSRVTFVVCFTLAGPKAKGIRFVDAKQTATAGKFNRQGSKVEKKKH